MLAKTALLCALCMALPALSRAEEIVKIHESERTLEEATPQQKRHAITISNPHARFTIHYLTALNPADPVGDASSAALWINEIVSAPSLHFNVAGGKFTLARQPFTVERIEGANRGIKVRWEVDGNRVELALVMTEDDPVLFGRWRVERDSGSRIVAILGPGGFATSAEERERRFLLPEGESFSPGEEPLALEAEGAIFFYDEKLDPAIGGGKAGAGAYYWSAAAPAELSFKGGAYVSTLTVSTPPEFNGLLESWFALRAFEQIPNDTAKTEFEAESGAILQKLMDRRETLFD